MTDFNDVIISELHDNIVVGWKTDELLGLANDITKKAYETRQERLYSAIKTIEAILCRLKLDEAVYVKEKCPCEYEVNVALQAKYNGFLFRLEMEKN